MFSIGLKALSRWNIETVFMLAICFLNAVRLKVLVLIHGFSLVDFQGHVKKLLELNLK